MNNHVSYIILINYNNWIDTIICVENLVQNSWKNCKIIIVDNASSDDSIEKIENYLEGFLDEIVKENYPVKDSAIIINKKKFQEFDQNLSKKLNAELSQISLIKSNKKATGFSLGAAGGRTVELAEAEAILEVLKSYFTCINTLLCIFLCYFFSLLLFTFTYTIFYLPLYSMYLNLYYIL